MFRWPDQLFFSARSALPPLLLLLGLVAPGIVGCASDSSSLARGTRVLPPRQVRGVWHRIAPGESLQQVARRYAVPLIDVEEINSVDRDQALGAGTSIFVPRGRPARRVAAARAPASPATTAGSSPRSLASGTRGQLIWPVRHGVVSSPFGRRGVQVHEGVDIAAPEGTAVVAAAAGTVIYSGSEIRGYGNLIIIRHHGELVTVYAHNRRNLVQRGAAIRQGQLVAEVGRSGRTSGAHLHFEVRSGERPLDPVSLLPPPASPSRSGERRPVSALLR